MKKSLIIGLLSLAASIAPSFGQGTIILDNYNTYGPIVTYGANVPANGVGGGAGSGGLSSAWTVGLFYAIGDVRGSIAPDASGTADPGSLGGGLLLGTGTGSTAGFASSLVNDTPGYFLAGAAYGVPGTLPAGGQTVTIMLIAYSGPSYAAAAYRGHSAAFIMNTAANNSLTPPPVGSAFTTFSVLPVPEPSTFALAGLGAAAMLILRRRQA